VGLGDTVLTMEQIREVIRMCMAGYRKEYPDYRGWITAWASWESQSGPAIVLAGQCWKSPFMGTLLYGMWEWEHSICYSDLRVWSIEHLRNHVLASVNALKSRMHQYIDFIEDNPKVQELYKLSGDPNTLTNLWRAYEDGKAKVQRNPSADIGCA